MVHSIQSPITRIEYHYTIEYHVYVYRTLHNTDNGDRHDMKLNQMIYVEQP